VIEKKLSTSGIIFLIAFIIATVLIGVWLWPFIARLRLPEYREQFSGWVNTMGIKGVLIVFGIQVLQIIVAVIPGGSVQILAGAAYGTLGGFAICILGCLTATAVIFLVVRKFGAPLVNRLFSPKQTGRYSFLKEPVGFQEPVGFKESSGFQKSRKLSLILFLIFLIPGTPKDALTYIASLQDIKLSRFILITTVARSPAILMSTMLGSSVLQGNMVLIVLLFLIIAATGIPGLLYGEKIIGRFRSQ
jgi:uncharacterized membrane protein YdjX (TVP38/TMEM64 family)